MTGFITQSAVPSLPPLS